MNTSERHARNTAIIDGYNSGKSTSELAAEHGVSEATVMLAVRNGRRAGQVTRALRSRSNEYHAKSNERANEIRTHYEAGLSMSEVGRRFGISRERVRQILQKQGVQSRSIGGQNSKKYENWVAEHGDEINKSFDELRSINKVVAAHPEMSAGWIRRLLTPRRKETIHSSGVPRYWTNERIISVLRSAAGHDHKLTVPMYNKWRESGVKVEGRTPPTFTLVVWRFGSWRNGVESAGLLSTRKTKRRYTRTWTSEDVLNSVRTYATEALESEKRPTFSGYEKWARESGGRHPSGSYLRWATGKTWVALLREATPSGS